jgi:hypothetical protein
VKHEKLDWFKSKVGWVLVSWNYDKCWSSYQSLFWIVPSSKLKGLLKQKNVLALRLYINLPKISIQKIVAHDYKIIPLFPTLHYNVILHQIFWFVICAKASNVLNWH